MAIYGQRSSVDRPPKKTYNDFIPITTFIIPPFDVAVRDQSVVTSSFNWNRDLTRNA